MEDGQSVLALKSLVPPQEDKGIRTCQVCHGRPTECSPRHDGRVAGIGCGTGSRHGRAAEEPGKSWRRPSIPARSRTCILTNRSGGSSSGTGRARTGCSSPPIRNPNARPWWSSSTAGSPSIRPSTAPGSTTWFGRANVVIFPRYQNDVGTLPQEFLPNAMAAIRDAMEVLEGGPKHVRPDLEQVRPDRPFGGRKPGRPDRRGRRRSSFGLASAPAVIALMPGEVFPSREPRLDRIAPSTLLLVAVGEDDLLVGDLRGRQIFTQASGIPRSRKRFLLFRSDRHGFPPSSPSIPPPPAPTASSTRAKGSSAASR